MTQMSADRNAFLGAYMDGQLDPDQQQRVESALATSPQLAAQLRKLVAVRDLLAGLRREAGVDVTSQVMNRIRPRVRPQARSFTLPRWNSRPLTSAAVAVMT